MPSILIIHKSGGCNPPLPFTTNGGKRGKQGWEILCPGPEDKKLFVAFVEEGGLYVAVSAGQTHLNNEHTKITAGERCEHCSCVRRSVPMQSGLCWAVPGDVESCAGLWMGLCIRVVQSRCKGLYRLKGLCRAVPGCVQEYRVVHSVLGGCSGVQRVVQGCAHGSAELEWVASPNGDAQATQKAHTRPAAAQIGHARNLLRLVE